MLLKIVHRKEARLLAALAAGGLVLSPAIAATGSQETAGGYFAQLRPVSSFTPANADPKLAAALGTNKGLALTDFKFTPAPAKGRPSQVRVAIRARAAAPTEASLAAASRNSGGRCSDADQLQSRRRGRLEAVCRFGRCRQDPSGEPALGGRESAVVGVSYSLNKRLTARVAVGAERGDGRALPALRKGDNYSLDVGGSYDLSRRIALTGGVRYNIERDRVSTLNRTPGATARRSTSAPRSSSDA